MGVFDKAQKRKKRLIKKRENTQRAAKAALDAMLELQRNPGHPDHAKRAAVQSGAVLRLLQELSGEDAEPIEYDDPDVLGDRLAVAETGRLGSKSRSEGQAVAVLSERTC
jgi:hypothetical protein